LLPTSPNSHFPTEFFRLIKKGNATNGNDIAKTNAINSNLFRLIAPSIQYQIIQRIIINTKDAPSKRVNMESPMNILANATNIVFPLVMPFQAKYKADIEKHQKTGSLSTSLE